MKRLIVIATCLFVIIAGAASAWASCKRVSFVGHPTSPASAHTHDHHADSPHNHGNGAVIHCPTLDVFLLTASFSSASKSDRVHRLPPVVLDELDSQLGVRRPYLSWHGPPGYSRSSNFPSYLFLSVLRI